MNISTKFPSKLVASLMLLTSIAASNQAAASLVELKWDEHGRFQHKAEIKTGSILEVCGQLVAGQKIDWQFNSTKALDFNIHFHEGKKVNLPVKQKARKESAGQFEVIRDQDYCWMWSNKTKNNAIIDLSLSPVPSK